MAAKKNPDSAGRKAPSRPVRNRRLNVRLPADLLDQISKIAAEEHRTSSALIVHVMTQHVQSKKSK